MPRIATATSAQDEEASSSRVDDLIQRGRSQGHLSLSDLRTAFEHAGLTPAEARSILRELSEAGVRLADEETDLAVAGKPSRAAKGAAKPALPTVSKQASGTAAKPAAKKTRTKKDDGSVPAGAGTQSTPGSGDSETEGDDAPPTIEADVAAFADSVDLDDQTPAMG